MGNTDPRQVARLLLAEHIRELTEEPRTPGSPGHRKAQAYIRAAMEEAGFRIEARNFAGSGFDGVNLLTEPVPAREELPLLIVGAHYDSAFGTPGADDNATGVAALLELANALKLARDRGAPWRARVQLAAYDLEEYGMIGSWTHSQEVEAAGSVVRGMISLEMLGYADHRPGSQRLPAHLAEFYPDVGDFIGLCGNEASRDFLHAVEAGMRAITDLPVESLLVPGQGEMLTEVRLSDHSSFWDRGYQALMITDTSFFRNPHYHQPTDTLETLDLIFLEKVTRGVCEAVQRVLTS
jgi:Zn-dependent M28 family amino/carboxypeptidase